MEFDFMKAGLLLLVLLHLQYVSLAGDVEGADFKPDQVGPESDSLSRLMRMFGQKTKEEIATDLRFWKPACNVTNKDALNAISRAKTEKCRREIESVSCLTGNEVPFPDFIPNLCDRFEENPRLAAAGGEHLGCYRDRLESRALGGYVRHRWELNRRTACTSMCSSNTSDPELISLTCRAGFSFAGLEWGGECFCGHSAPPAEDKIAPDHCSLPCPLSPGTCGGSLAIDVFYTGVRIVRRDFEVEQLDGVSIVFLMTVSGRSVRQVRRLLRQIYRPHHFYFIHVDQSSQWLFSQLETLQTFPNIKLATQRFQTFWASNTLLYLLLTSMKDILELGWDFDYLVNISESDFPVRPLEQFEIYLRNNNGRNFVAMGDENMVKFQNGQGMRKLFYNCDGRMNRLGDRDLPFGLQWVGGSDWVILHRDFVHYLVTSDDSLVRGLTSFYFYSIMAPESFFHTALLNSRFCRSFSNNNFRFINWNKGKNTGACSCDRGIDWCGCSPHVIRTEKINKFLHRMASNQRIFFARKFDPVIEQNPINLIEESFLEGLGNRTPGWNKYWLNSYNQLDDRTDLSSATVSLGRLVLSVSKLACRLTGAEADTVEMREMTSYFSEEKYSGELIQWSASNGVFEAIVRARHHQQVSFSPGYSGLLSRSIRQIKVGSNWDEREKIFRNYLGAFSPSSSLKVLLEFGPAAAQKPKVLAVTLYDEREEVRCELMVLLAWRQGQALLNLHHCAGRQHEFQPGLWTLQDSPDSEPFPDSLKASIRAMFPVTEACVVESESCQDLPSCYSSPWSSLAPDPKSEFNGFDKSLQQPGRRRQKTDDTKLSS